MNDQEYKPVKVSATDLLANERTFLAWVRTALGVVALGFVIVKFSLFISQLALLNLEPNTILAGMQSKQLLADVIGILMICLGCAMLPLGYFRYRKTDRELSRGNLRNDKMLPLLTVIALVLVVVMLLVYMIL